jgi:hypothetical protein
MLEAASQQLAVSTGSDSWQAYFCDRWATSVGIRSFKSGSVSTTDDSGDTTRYCERRRYTNTVNEPPTSCTHKRELIFLVNRPGRSWRFANLEVFYYQLLLLIVYFKSKYVEIKYCFDLVAGVFHFASPCRLGPLSCIGLLHKALY